MRRGPGWLLLGLLSSTTAAGADAASCAVRADLYESWVARAPRTSRRTTLSRDALTADAIGISDTATRAAIRREYSAFFECISLMAKLQSAEAVESSCKEAGDSLASLVCKTILYVKNGRTAAKEFLDSFPSGKKAQMIWDLEAITDGAGGVQQTYDMFPNGPAYKLIDELFLLVLDNRESAVVRYFNVLSLASPQGQHYLGRQVQILLLEAPAVVVRQWPVLRKYQPQLKKLLSEITARMQPAELKRMRQGLAGFCTQDNLDCPEILKTFGPPE